MSNIELLSMNLAIGVTQPTTQISQLSLPGSQSSQLLTFILFIADVVVSPTMVVPQVAKTNIFATKTARKTVSNLFLEAVIRVKVYTNIQFSQGMRR